MLSSKECCSPVNFCKVDLCAKGVCVLQVLIKQGELMKLSRKDMQPRMFFLVSPPCAFLCMERSFSHGSEWTWKVEIRTRKTFLTVGEAYIWLYYDLLHFLVSPPWAFVHGEVFFP